MKGFDLPKQRVVYSTDQEGHYEDEELTVDAQHAPLVLDYQIWVDDRPLKGYTLACPWTNQEEYLAR